MDWFRWLFFALALAIPAAGHAEAASSATTFCDDTAKLQEWLGQSFLPGIDQYDQNPNRPYVKSMGDYLTGLAEEAPDATKADLAEWAAFTEKVADGSSSADLTADAATARAAAGRVKVWLAAESGCPQLYQEAAPSSGSGGFGIPTWLIVVLVVVGILVAGLFTKGGGPTRRTVVGSARSPSTGTFGGSQTRTCAVCHGGKYQTHGVCNGTGRITTNDSGRQAEFANSTGMCLGCQGTGRSACSGCHGTGVSG